MRVTVKSIRVYVNILIAFQTYPIYIRMRSCGIALIWRGEMVIHVILGRASGQWSPYHSPPYKCHVYTCIRCL